MSVLDLDPGLDGGINTAAHFYVLSATLRTFLLLSLHYPYDLLWPTGCGKSDAGDVPGQQSKKSRSFYSCSVKMQFPPSEDSQAHEAQEMTSANNQTCE